MGKKDATERTKVLDRRTREKISIKWQPWDSGQEGHIRHPWPPIEGEEEEEQEREREQELKPAKKKKKKKAEEEDFVT